MRLALALALTCVLVGCTGDNPEARKALAACELAAPAADRNADGTYNEPYIDTCMQAKGYVRDERLSIADGRTCKAAEDDYEEAACYRDDNEVAKWLVGLQNDQKAN